MNEMQCISHEDLFHTESEAVGEYQTALLHLWVFVLWGVVKCASSSKLITQMALLSLSSDALGSALFLTSWCFLYHCLCGGCVFHWDRLSITDAVAYSSS
jgi:hypothetical protein